ncbi:MAG: outer membrane protein OmpA-like peptidoglycan-associated protein [Glaciecola sp.]|jgi:outer membrane protein OmpA-like peptidoglycan-associated protein
MKIKFNKAALRCILAVIVFQLSFVSFAQDGNCDIEVPKKAINKFKKLKKNSSLRSTEVNNKIKELIVEYPNFVDPVYYLAELYKKMTFSTSEPELKKKFISKTISYYEQSISICPEFSGHLAYYYLGIFHHKYNKDLKTAAHHFQNYLDKELEHPKSYKKIATNLADEYFTKFRLLKHPVQYDPEGLEGVNTDEDEYLPMLTPDNNYLYLTRKRTTPLDLSQPLKNGNDHNEYFCKSKKMYGGLFSNGRLLGKPFNQFREPISGLKLVGQGGICITPDNKEMYITLTLLVPAKGTGYKNTQLYYTKKRDGQWSPLKPVGRNINDENNLPTWEGQATISADGKMMVFSTARPSSIEFSVGSETYNSMDLYVVHKMTNGIWGRPKSLGDVINTPGNEKTPFLHTDSKTLYFSSNGHPGMGGYDIFFSQMTDEGEWTKPKNIGYPINTSGDEHGLMVSLDGKYAYMSTGKKTGPDGGLDIVHFPLHKKARPEKVMFIKGKLEAENGDVVKNGRITITDEGTGEVHEAIVDETTGEYVVVVAVRDPKKEKLKKETVILQLDDEEHEVPFGSKIAAVNGKEEIIPPGAKIIQLNEKKEVVLKKGEKIRKVNEVKTVIAIDEEVVVKKNKQKVVKREVKDAGQKKTKKQKFLVSATGDDMAFSTESIEVDPEEVDGVVKMNDKKIEIKKGEKGEVIRLNEVNFAVNSYLLDSKCMLVLDELIKFLNAKPQMKITIHGHTDNVGSEDENLKLSDSRAKEVKEFLIDNGISQERLSHRGFGSSKPKKSNNTEGNRLLNRRVEFVILNR